VLQTVTFRVPTDEDVRHLSSRLEFTAFHHCDFRRSGINRNVVPEVHGDLLCGKMETSILERGANTVAALPHRGIGKPDDRELWKPSGNINLHIDQMGIDTDECSTENLCEHGQFRYKTRGG